VYLIRLEEEHRLPRILHSILHRNGLRPGDNPYRIRPTALLPADSEEAFFFNNVERQTKVTVIGQNRPGFFDTIRLVQPPDGQLSPRAIFQTISGHRLFQLNESSSLDRHRARTRYGSTELLDPTPQPEMSRDQTTIEAGPRDVMTETVPSQDSQEPSAPFNSTPMLSMNPNEVPRPQMSRDQTAIEAGPRAVITEIVPSQKSQEPSAPFNLTPLLSLNPNEAPRPKRGRATLEAE